MSKRVTDYRPSLLSCHLHSPPPSSFNSLDSGELILSGLIILFCREAVDLVFKLERERESNLFPPSYFPFPLLLFPINLAVLIFLLLLIIEHRVCSLKDLPWPPFSALKPHVCLSFFPLLSSKITHILTTFWRQLRVNGGGGHLLQFFGGDMSFLDCLAV